MSSLSYSRCNEHADNLESEIKALEKGIKCNLEEGNDTEVELLKREVETRRNELHAVAEMQFHLFDKVADRNGV